LKVNCYPVIISVTACTETQGIKIKASASITQRSADRLSE